MKSRWIESSSFEEQIARDITRKISEFTQDPDVLCGILDDLAYDLTGTPTRLTKVSAHVIDELRRETPQFWEMDTRKCFPDNSNDLTTNVFSRIAHEASAESGLISSLGVVDTPSVLAEDMVVAAATFWLTGRMKLPLNEILRVLTAPVQDQFTLKDAVASELWQARWYDPCVGGGVFPLCILQLLWRIGLKPSTDLLDRIVGNDINPVAVTATRIRMALAASNYSGEGYAAIRQNVQGSFSIGNSLERVSEQQLMQADIDRESLIADIVVGNPPYVRASRLSTVAKEFLKEAFPSVAVGFADLYIYFIAHGLLALRQGGILCYVSPASFQKSKSGEGIRQFIYQHAAVEAVFDFDELPIFDEVNVHTSVYLLSKSMSNSTMMVYSYTNMPEKLPLIQGLAQATLRSAPNATSDMWNVAQPESEALLALIGRDSIPLIQYCGQIYSGIKTGHKEAYFVSKSDAEQMKHCQEAQQILRPMLRPVSIRTWRSNWDGTHLLLVKKGQMLSEDSCIMARLSRYEDELRRRTDVLGHPTWYGLRECTYYEVFERPKIIFPDIAAECRFAIDVNGFLIPDGSFMIPMADYFLLAVLNSCIGRFYFRVRCNTIGNPHNRGRLRFKKTYVGEFPVKKITENTQGLKNQISRLAQSLVSGEQSIDAAAQIDDLVIQLYDVPVEYQHLLK